MLLCLLLSSAAIGGTGIIKTYHVVTADAAQAMNLLCTVRAEKLNRILSEIMLSTETLKNYALAEFEGVEKLQEDASYAKAFSDKLVGPAVSTAENTQGAVAVYLRFSPELTDSQSGFFYSRERGGSDFEKQIPTDLSVYDKTDTEHVGWFYHAKENGKGIWMDPYFNKNIGVQMISYVIPIYKDGYFLGVVGLDINFEYLQEIVSETTVYRTGYAFLTSDTAKVVYHKDISNGTDLETYNNGEFQDFAGLLKQEQESSGDTLYSYIYNGVPKNASFLSLVNGMKFVLTAPVSEIEENLNQLIKQVIIQMLFILAVAVCISICVTRKLVKPLIELNTAAQKIANGDLDVLLTCHSHDEIGTLSESFRQTVAHLKHYIDYINNLAYRDLLTGVKNRTAYLEAGTKMDEMIRLKKPEFALAVFDVNNLKAVNDALGHEFGDMVIIDSSKLISKVFRKYPVYRIGGDEFVVILEDVGTELCRDLMAQLESELSVYNKHSEKGTVLSIAGGAAVYTQETDLTFGDVFKRADSIMYENKTEKKKAKS